MPSSPNFLPVYNLPEVTSPTENDYLVTQVSGSSGDVGLLPISQFLNVFMQEYIDQVEIDSTTKALYTAMGWTEPTE